MSNIPRRARRVITSIKVRWGFTKDCPYTGTIINLTVLGCAVQFGGRTKVKPGQVVLIRFWRPRKRILKVEVVHNSLKEAKGFGAKFLDLNEEEKDTLEQLVQLFGEPEPANNPELKSKFRSIRVNPRKSAAHVLNPQSEIRNSSQVPSL